MSSKAVRDYDVIQKDYKNIKDLFQKMYKAYMNSDVTIVTIRFKNFWIDISKMNEDMGFWNNKYKLIKVRKIEQDNRVEFVFEKDPMIDKEIKSHKAGSIKQKIIEFCRLVSNSKLCKEIHILIPKEIQYHSFGEQDLYDWLFTQGFDSVAIEDDASGDKKVITIGILH